MGKMLIRNIGAIVSGDIHQPRVDGDAVLVDGQKITWVGKGKDFPGGADRVIDARGMMVCPGFIDSHVHTVLGDYTPRQKTVDYIDSYLHGGVTTMIAAGPVHTPGRPKDAAGAKAMAILFAKTFNNYRPSGVKVLGGAVLLEKGLREQDFEEMAREGVTHLGEIGIGSLRDVEEIAQMVRWSKKNGMRSMIHCGGGSLPGVGSWTGEQILKIDPTIASHINGGTTAPFWKDVEKIVRESSIRCEFVSIGNPKITHQTLDLILKLNALDRVILGSDCPSGIGVMPDGPLQYIKYFSCMTDLKPEVVIGLHTGNQSRVFGLNQGFIREGYLADLLMLDAPLDSVAEDALGAFAAGDMPSIVMVMVEGEILVHPSRNTTVANKDYVVEK